MVLDTVDRVDITDSVRIVGDSDDSREISDNNQDDGDQIDTANQNDNDDGHIVQILQEIPGCANNIYF